jgi:hypothetical protein
MRKKSVRLTLEKLVVIKFLAFGKLLMQNKNDRGIQLARVVANILHERMISIGQNNPINIAEFFHGPSPTFCQYFSAIEFVLLNVKPTAAKTGGVRPRPLPGKAWRSWSSSKIGSLWSLHEMTP